MKKPYNKYGNRKVAGFDSQREFNRYAELKLLERAGRISDLKRQVKYELIPAQYGENGRCLYRATNYIADFVYTENGKTVVEDCKGFRTDVYQIKKKLMYWIYKVVIRET